MSIGLPRENFLEKLINQKIYRQMNLKNTGLNNSKSDSWGLMNPKINVNEIKTYMYKWP